MRTPPHSMEAEMAVLGAMLIDPRCLLPLLGEMQESDFYRADHQAIFRAIRAVHAADKPVDLMTLTDYAKRTDTLQAMGGQAYLYSLGMDLTGTANASAYAAIVREKAQLRALIAIGQTLAQSGFEPGEATPSALVDSAVSDLIRVSSARGSVSRRFSESVLATEQAIAETRRRRLSGRLAGAPTGIPALDDSMDGLHGPKLIIVAARPSIGKTALLNQMATHMAANGYGGFVASLEMSEDQNVIRTAAEISGRRATRISQGENPDYDQAWDALTDLGDIPLWTNYDTYTLSAILAQAAQHKHQHGINWVAVDHIGLVESEVRGNTNEKIGQITRSLKLLAKRLNVPVIALSQLSRTCDSENRPPQLNDLRDSGNIEQDADAVVMLHTPIDARSEDPKPLHIGVLKNRGGRTGWQKNYQFHGSCQRIVTVG